MLRSIGLLALVFHCAFAAAELEIKAHYGMLNGKPTDWNEDIETVYVGNPDVSNVGMLGADVVYAIPILPFSFGIRYEMLMFKKNGPVTVATLPLDAKTELTGNRISLLGGMRLIETPIGYLGLLAHYAIQQKMQYNIDLCSGGACSDNKYTGTMDPSFGIGADAAVTLGSFLVGAEVGYTLFKAKGMKDEDGDYLNGSDGKKIPFDLSGTYFKVMLGLSL